MWLFCSIILWILCQFLCAKGALRNIYYSFATFFLLLIQDRTRKMFSIKFLSRGKNDTHFYIFCSILPADWIFENMYFIHCSDQDWKITENQYISNPDLDFFDFLIFFRLRWLHNIKKIIERLRKFFSLLEIKLYKYHELMHTHSSAYPRKIFCYEWIAFSFFIIA